MGLDHAGALLVVYINVVLYSVCYMMQQPALPYLVDKLGASTTQFASLQSLFNGAQAVGGLLSGPVLDHFGGKTLLLISFAASIVCYGMTAAATNLTMLYISRLTTVLQHAVLAARSIVTTSTREQHRAAHLGYVGMCVGLGMSSGPMLGGLLSDVSLQFSAWLATAGSVISFLLVLFFVPSETPEQVAEEEEEEEREQTGGQGQAQGKSGEAAKAQDGTKGELRRRQAGPKGEVQGSQQGSGTGERKVEAKDGGEAVAAQSVGGGASVAHKPVHGSFGIGAYVEVFSAPGVSELMMIKMAANLASALFQGMMATLMKVQGMTPKHVGAAMSLVGMMAILVQGFCVAPTIKRFGESRTQLYSCWGLLFSFLLLSGARGFIPMLIALIPMSASSIILSAVSTARLTKLVPKAFTGTALSLDMGMWSAVRMAAPVMGARLLMEVGPPAIGGGAAVIMAALLGAIHLGFVAC